jgi:pSer/pThr/pTyr-binding forkhead associated (FHA) protein
MQAKLVVVEPAGEPGEYEIELPLTIGRGHEASLQLRHALVSRQHCELFEDRGRIMVRDLGSLNGTFVSGERVETAPLLPGQLLTIGTVTLRVVYEGDAILAQSTTDVRVAPVGEDTVSMEDTAEATARRETDDIGEPIGFYDDSKNDFLKPSDN